MTDSVTYAQIKLKTKGRQKKAVFDHGASSTMENEGPPVKRKVYCTQSVFLFSIVCTLLTAVIVILGITIMKKLAYIEETEKICSMQNLHKYIISLNDKFEEFKSDISKAYQECNRNQTSENDIFKQHLLRRVCTNGTGNKGLPCFLCPFDWLQYKDMCYFISKENKTWFESRNYCIAAKADLSEFKDPHHLTFLQEKLNEGEGGYWIGLRQQSSIEPWKWLDGTTLDVKQSPFHVVTNSGSSHVYITKKNIFTGMAQNKKMCICSRSAASV